MCWYMKYHTVNTLHILKDLFRTYRGLRGTHIGAIYRHTGRRQRTESYTPHRFTAMMLPEYSIGVKRTLNTKIVWINLHNYNCHICKYVYTYPLLTTISNRKPPRYIADTGCPALRAGTGGFKTSVFHQMKVRIHVFPVYPYTYTYTCTNVYIFI